MSAGSTSSSLGGATGCAFVSKDELGHGFIHWLADQNGTVYVRRTHSKGAKDQALAIATALEARQPVALFPEGTAGPGDQLAAVPLDPARSRDLSPARDVDIRPVALDYGAAAAEIGWYEEAGKDNVLRILGRRGTLPVTVRLLDPLDRAAATARSWPDQAREAIAQALALQVRAQLRL